MYVAFEIVVGGGIDLPGQETTDDDLPDLMSSDVTSYDEDIRDTLKEFQTTLRMEHQDRHMANLRSRIDTEANARAVELQ